MHPNLMFLTGASFRCGTYGSSFLFVLDIILHPDLLSHWLASFWCILDRPLESYVQCFTQIVDKVSVRVGKGTQQYETMRTGKLKVLQNSKKRAVGVT